MCLQIKTSKLVQSLNSQFIIREFHKTQKGSFECIGHPSLVSMSRNSARHWKPSLPASGLSKPHPAFCNLSSKYWKALELSGLVLSKKTSVWYHLSGQFAGLSLLNSLHLAKGRVRIPKNQYSLVNGQQWPLSLESEIEIFHWFSYRIHINW